MIRKHFFVLFACFYTFNVFCQYPNIPIQCLLDVPSEKSYQPGSWSIGIKGGIHPAWYTVRSDSFFFEQPSPEDLNPIKKRLDTFNRQYELPWIAGGEISMILCPRLEIFAEGDYTAAFSKKIERSLNSSNNESEDDDYNTYEVKFSNYRATGGYLGVRAYSPSFWCCQFAAFIGAKMGLLYRQHASGFWEFELDNEYTSLGAQSFKKGWVPSGGIQVGVNYDPVCCYSLFLKVEILLSGCWGTGHFNAGDPGPYVVLGQTGPVMSLPVTMGVRMNF